MLKRLVHNPIAQTLLKHLYYPLLRMVIQIRCRWSDLQLRLRNSSSPPVPPAFLRFRVGESLAVDEFLEVGKRSADNLSGALQSIDVQIKDSWRVLDFGCGCGRTLQWMIQRHPLTEFHGSDIDRDSIEWCSQNLSPARCSVSPDSPPLPLSDSQFDLVYAISVFTHLRESHQFLWLPELARIIKEKGSLALTVHGASAWGDYRPQRENELEDQGMIFHSAPRLQGFFPDWYGTSFHSRRYVEERFRRVFREVTYLEGGMGYQDLVVCRYPLPV